MEQRRLNFYVENGRLELNPGLEARVSMLTEGSEITSSGPITIEGATEILGALPTRIEEFSNVALTRVNNQVGLTIKEGSVVDSTGKSILPPQDQTLTIGLVLAAFLVTIGALAFVLSRQRAARHVYLAYEAMAIGNFQSAARHASRAAQKKFLEREASVLTIIALIRAGEHDDAERAIQTFGESPKVERAAFEFLRACASAARGNLADSKLAIRECLRLNPNYAKEAASNPLLAGIAAKLGIDGGYA